MPTTPLDLLPGRPAEPELTADCSRCFALCCVLLPYSRAAGFGADKPGGVPCPQLADDDRCTIHADLRERGWPGCTVFDCFGAGQQVAQVTYGGTSGASTTTSARWPAVLSVMRRVHEMLAHLGEVAPPYAGARGARPRGTGCSRCATRRPVELLTLDLDELQDEVGDVLAAASARVRGDGPDLRRTDLAGADLRDRELRDAGLRGALLIGADLRGRRTSARPTCWAPTSGTPTSAAPTSPTSCSSPSRRSTRLAVTPRPGCPRPCTPAATRTTGPRILPDVRAPHRSKQGPERQGLSQRSRRQTTRDWPGRAGAAPAAVGLARGYAAGPAPGGAPRGSPRARPPAPRCAGRGRRPGSPARGSGVRPRGRCRTR